MRFYDPATTEREECEDIPAALRRGLVPSVTSILSIIRYEHLETWYIKKSLERYCATGDLQEAAAYRDSTAAEFGTTCHALVQAFATGTSCELAYDQRHHRAVQPLLNWFEEKVESVVFSEAMFADADLGFGGTADLLLRLNDGFLLLADVKCKKHSTRFPMTPDIAHKYQLSAYRQYFSRHYGEMNIGNLLLASPFGYAPQPCLQVHNYGTEDWMPGFTAAHHLWLEQHGGDRGAGYGARVRSSNGG